MNARDTSYRQYLSKEDQLRDRCMGVLLMCIWIFVFGVVYFYFGVIYGTIFWLGIGFWSWMCGYFSVERWLK